MPDNKPKTARKLSPRTVERRAALAALAEAEDRAERLRAKSDKLSAARTAAVQAATEANRVATEAENLVVAARADVARVLGLDNGHVTEPPAPLLEEPSS